MKNHLLIFLIAGTVSFAQAQPGTDIYLFDLVVDENSVVIKDGFNMTNRMGYDNQPFFHPDKPVLYFVSADSLGRTDIYQYDYRDKKKTRLTTTHDREYSPTVTPDKKFLSCILQNDSGAQYLVKYPIEGGNRPEILIDNLIVGYHAWMNQDQVVTFVLPQPFQLHLINVKTNSDVVVSEKIGRSLHRIPKTESISFIQKLSDTEWEIKQLTKEGKVSTLAKSLASVERDMTWTPDGKIVMSDEKKLYFMDPSKKSEWKEIALPDLVRTSITRLAISHDGKKIAIVVAE